MATIEIHSVLKTAGCLSNVLLAPKHAPAGSLAMIVTFTIVEANKAGEACSEAAVTVTGFV